MKLKNTHHSLAKSGLLLCTAAVAFNVSAENTKVQQFNIPAQSLQTALNQFSETTDMQMSYPASLAAGVKTEGVFGEYTSEQALEKLLSGSGLKPSLIDNTVTIKHQKQSALATSTLLAAAANENYPVTKNGVANNSQQVIEQEELTVSGQKMIGYSVLNSSTATRTDTALMELPQSIQVIPRSLIDDQQAVTVSESLRNVSGVVARNPNISPNFEPTLVRGFSTMQMLDGFYQNLNTGDQGSLVSIEQIEVLKGANATLYSGGGGSPVGGVINLTSKLPQKEASYEMGVKVSTEGFVQPFVDINRPINENVLFRFTGEYTNSENDIDVLKTERYNLNPTLTFTDNDSTTFTVQGKYSKFEQQDYQGLPATGTVAGDFKIDPQLYIGPENIADSSSEFGSVWGTLDHQINDIWSITAKARYAYSKHDTKSQGILGEGFSFGADKPFMPPSIWGVLDNELYQESNEMSFQFFTTADFDLGISQNTFIIGADFSQHKEDGFMAFDMTRIGVVDLMAPVFMPYVRPGTGESNQFVKNTTTGGYMQLQTSLYERVHLLGGFRVAYVATDFNNTTPGFEFASKSSNTKVLPNVGAVVDLTDEYAVFVNYNEGMRAQGGATNFVSTPEPELSNQVEVGMKFNIAEQLSGQLALFQIERKNVAVTDFTDAQFRSVADGKQKSRGFESNMTWQATDALSFLATYAFTDARFSDSLIVPQGNRLPGVPEHAGRFWANYAFQNSMLRGLSIGSGIYSQSSVYLANDNAFKAPSYYTMDASIGYQRDFYKLGMSIKNLTNNSYYQRLNYFGTRVTQAQGTEVFFTGSIMF